MRGWWRPAAIGRVVLHTRQRGRRTYSSFTRSVERVSLKNGISGDINVE